MTDFPRTLPALAVLLLATASCVSSDATTGVGRGVAAVAPVFSLIPSPADSTALPIDRIRVAVSRVSDGQVLHQVTMDVNPTDAAWTIDVQVPSAFASEPVYVFVWLLSASGPVESVEFSGRAGPLDLVPGQTLPLDVPIVRGPVANLFTTGVAVNAAPASLVMGQSAVLGALAMTTGPGTPTIYWTSLDTTIVRMSADTAIAVRSGAARVAASAGAYADTASIDVFGFLTIATSSLPGGVQNGAYAQTLAAAGGDGVYTWVLQSGSLPSGLGLATQTGAISGTPTLVEAKQFTVEVTSGDGQTATRQLSIAVADDDPAGFTVTESAGGTTVSESGSIDDLTVVLDAQPLTDVVLDVASGDVSEVTTSPTTLTFTNATWNVAQTVVLTGIDDTVTAGDQITSVTISVDPAASDDAFDALAPQVVAVTTVDDDGGGGSPAPLRTWTGSGDGMTWIDPANWSGGVAPSAADSVVIDLAGSVTVQLVQSATVHSLSIGGPSGLQLLAQSAGTLTVTNAVSVGLLGTYNITGGTGAFGSGTVDGSISWQGGSISVVDTLSVTSSGAIALVASSTFGGGTIVNDGTFVWSAGNLTFQNGATLVNDGLMEIFANALFQPFAGGTLINNGIIEQNNSGGSFLIDAFNHGTVDIQAGTLNFSGQGAAAHTGVFIGSAAAYLGFAGSGAQQVDSTITGFARVNVVTNVTFNGTLTTSWLSVNQLDAAIVNAPLLVSDSVTLQGTLTLNAGAGATDIPRLRMFNQNNGGVSGAGELTITDSLLWEGGRISGPGTRTVASTAGARIYNTGSGNAVIDGVPLLNEGVVRFSSNVLFMEGGGSFDNAPGAQFLAAGPGSLTINTTTNGAFFNAGTFVKGSGVTTLTISTALWNSPPGSIEIQSGTLDLNSAFTQEFGASLFGSGALDLAGATAIALAGTVNPGPSGGAGLLSIIGPGLPFAQDALSTFELEIGGTTPGSQHDLLSVTGVLDLHGALAVDTIASFTPTAGDSFAVLTVSAGHTGSFTSVTFPSVTGVAFDTLWTGTTPDTLFIVASGGVRHR